MPLLGTRVERRQSQVLPTWQEVAEQILHSTPIPKETSLGLPSAQPWRITKTDKALFYKGVSLAAPELLFAYGRPWDKSPFV